MDELLAKINSGGRVVICGAVSQYSGNLHQMTEHVEKGIGSFPHALAKMFSGGHIGKMLVQVGGGDE